MMNLLGMLNLIAIFLLFHKNVLTFHLILMIVYFHWHVYELQSLLSLSSFECRTKSPPERIPPGHFCIGGYNSPHVFCN